MAEIEPLRALHYDLAVTGPLQNVVSPPYDVIDEPRRAELVARSPYNAVTIDLPDGGDERYETAALTLDHWRDTGVIVADDEPALWTLAQEYTGPDGRRRTRRGFFARVRVEEYGPGRIRPHERTHPGPKEDRLRLTRATKANLSPIFTPVLRSRRRGDGRTRRGHGRRALGRRRPTPTARRTRCSGSTTRRDRHRPGALASSELLIADGHHRYETARVYADEIGGEGPHRYVLMCLVALEDPGLTVFPTHRLVAALTA